MVAWQMETVHQTGQDHPMGGQTRLTYTSSKHKLSIDPWRKASCRVEIDVVLDEEDIILVIIGNPLTNTKICPELKKK